MEKKEKIEVMQDFIRAFEALEKLMDTENDVGNLLTETYTLPDDFSDMGWFLKEWLNYAISKYDKAEYYDIENGKLLTEEQLRDEYFILKQTNLTEAENYQEYKENCLDGFLELIK